MKKRLGQAVVILFTLTLLPIPFVSAQDSTVSQDPNQPVSSDTNSATNNSFEIDDTKAADYQAKLQTRLAEREKELQTKLTAFQEKRIAARCVASQKLITQVSERATQAKTSRDQIYTNILGSATKIRDRLKVNGKDTTKLDTSIAELETLITTFKTDLQTLRQTAQDITGMDCATDASSFKASLEALRTERSAVATDSEAIRTYIKDNLKPVLQEIRTAIGATKTEAQNEGDTN